MSKPVSRGRLLVVDDEVDLMRGLCEWLTEAGFETKGLNDPALALAALEGGACDVLLCDLMMPGTTGIQLLRQALQRDPTIVGIIMTGQGTIPSAVEAMRAGAFDYVLKPFRLQQVLSALDRAMEVRRLKTENARLRRVLGTLTYESPRYRIIGGSALIRKVIQLIEKVAPTDATVLVRGPSGTGKELVARAVHGNSARRDQPLVTVNCAALQENLLENELFGHEKGAFTGAERLKPGLFEAAEGGTLFIDEVAEMAPAMQAKLLRVLEEGRYRRVGSTQELIANVRVVAATNRVLEDEVRAGRFREDLFFRLNVVAVALPPLRDRRDDVPALVAHFLQTRPIGRGPFDVNPDALAVLCGYDWPGNVRELANVLERAQILAEGNTITVDDLPETVVHTSRPEGPPATPAATVGPDDLGDMERRHLVGVLQKHDGNKVRAARALGVSRRTLYRLIERYGLGTEPPPDGSSAG